MKYFASTLLLAASVATTVLASAEVHANDALVHAQAGVARRHAKTVSRRTCKAKKGANASANGSGTAKVEVAAAATSSSSSASSSSATSSPGNGSKPPAGAPSALKNKKGLAWPNSDGMDINNFVKNGISWFYTWGATPAKTNAPEDMLFCSMLWGDSGSGANLDDYKSSVVNNPDSHQNRHKCTMGMNEVNQQGQADMDVSRACNLMRQYQVPLKRDHGYYLVGPSTTSAPAGLDQWYKQFMTECKDVFDQLDAVSIHWYDVNLDDFKAYVQKWHQTTGKPLWVTEMACQQFNQGPQCTKDQAWNLLVESAKWLDEQDYVVAYTTFGVMQNLQGVAEGNRMSVGSSPTALFNAWSSA